VLFTQVLTIVQSATVSDVAQFQRRPLGRALSLFAPVVTSCQLFAQVSFDTSSANFRRAQNPAGSGDWTWSLGPGSKAIQADALAAFAFFRLETSIAQASSATTFTLAIKE
jgi:hypothetical protein